VIVSVAPGTGSIVKTAGPAIMIRLMNSAGDVPLTEAVSAVPKIGVGVGVGVDVGVDVGVGVGVGGNMPARTKPRCPDVPGLSCVKFLIVKYNPSFT
jgi:hypothetical protein